MIGRAAIAARAVAILAAIATVTLVMFGHVSGVLAQQQRKPSRNGPTRWASRAAVEFPRKPIRWTFPAGCAQAASGATKNRTATTEVIGEPTPKISSKRFTTFLEI